MKLKFTLLALLATLTLTAQDKKKDDKKDWDVNNPPGDNWNWKPVQFTTNEDTWMNLDVTTLQP